MKKIFVFILALFISVTLLNVEAQAQEITINNSGTYDISEFGDNKVLIISGTMNVTLTNENNYIYNNFNIVCKDGFIDLTIHNIKITSSYNLEATIIDFNANGMLTLAGDVDHKNIIDASHSGYHPAIKVPSDIKVTIDGSGHLIAYGGYRAPGIGGGYAEQGGKITILRLVQAVRKGKCIIKATADDKSDSCYIKVAPDPQPIAILEPEAIHRVASLKLTINPGTVTLLHVGDTLDLIANIFPENAYNQAISWQSSDVSVARVSSTGHVRALSQGSATITASASGYSDNYKIIVQNLTSASPAPTSAPSETYVYQTTSVAEYVTILSIDKSILPKDTRFLILPCGEIIEMPAASKIMQVTVPCDDIEENGGINLLALDRERIPLSSVESNTAFGSEKPYGVSSLAVILSVFAALIAGSVTSVLICKHIREKRHE